MSLVQVFPTDLETVYAALPKGGYGRLAVLESAMVENRIRTWVIRDLGQPRLALAAPAKAGDRLVGVAYIQLPFTELTSGLDTIGMVGDTYLGLRQGDVTLWERGDQSYADGAERLAAAVAESGLRVVAATSQPPTQALGMGAVASLIAAVIALVWLVISFLAVTSRTGRRAAGPRVISTRLLCTTSGVATTFSPHFLTPPCSPIRMRSSAGCSTSWNAWARAAIRW